MAAGLNPKQAAFVREYLLDLNATQAAIRAGYSEKTAHSQGPRLLEHDGVAAAIQAALDERAERTQVSADRVVAELAAIAFSDLRDVATWGRDWLSLIDSSEIDAGAARAIREVVATTTATEHGESTRMHVRQHDKLRALELLGKHLGMFKRDVDVRVSGSLTVERLVELAGEADDDLDP